jgi:hypothetical protein
MFKRLLPAFLVTILLAGLATAQAAGATRNSRAQSVGGSTSQFRPGYINPRLDFGTVVRDTADEQSVGPGHWQAPRAVSLWNSFFTWNWFSLLIPR